LFNITLKVIDAGHFWAAIAEQESSREFGMLETALQKGQYNDKEVTSIIAKNS